MARMDRVRTAMAMIVFNRPEVTRRVFERIAIARPSMLFVIADGPRNDSERERCERARSVIEQVNWPCDVRTQFSKVNLGCRRRVSSGLDWVFEQVEETIILEDDCIPDPSFFRYCDELLAHWRHDERVMSISGDNFQNGIRRSADSYYFSIIAHVWGWATWRRAWKKYDVTMRNWPAFRDSPAFAKTIGSESVANGMIKAFDRVHSGEVDTWDTQWTFATWYNGGLTALPEVNLISNIGFGADATHTKSSRSDMAAMPTAPMAFPLRHPTEVRPNREADLYTLDHHTRTRSV